MNAWSAHRGPYILGISVILIGAAAYATGRAVANTWRPVRQVLVYCLLLAAGARFLIYALFQGTLLSATGFVTDAAVLTIIGLVGYRITHVRKMAAQYPWLYERIGLWRYRERASR